MRKGLLSIVVASLMMAGAPALAKKHGHGRAAPRAHQQKAHKASKPAPEPVAATPPPARAAEPVAAREVPAPSRLGRSSGPVVANAPMNASNQAVDDNEVPGKKK